MSLRAGQAIGACRRPHRLCRVARNYVSQYQSCLQSRAISIHVPFHWPKPDGFPTLNAGYSHRQRYTTVTAVARSQQFILTTSDARVVSGEELLKKIECQIQSKNLGTGSFNSAVILATPAFAALLIRGTFISKILHTIFQETRILGVDILVAVVDGLPDPDSTSASQALSATEIKEGVALLLGDQARILPNLWQDGAESMQPTSEVRSSLKFTSLSTGKTDESNFRGDEAEIVIPLANTMFVTGRASTLIASHWSRSEQGGEFERASYEHRTSQCISSTDWQGNSRTNLALPLVPLTPARKVMSGLGNIVRQVAGDDGKPQPASKELETNLDSFFEVTRTEKQSVCAWALIIPEKEVKELPGSTNEAVRVTEFERLSADVTKLWTTRPSSDTVPFWINRGAGLHRVLSGGGGWGAKAGLLSLDPETKVTQAMEAWNDFNPFESAEKEKRHALGEIAKPGSIIQFFTTPSGERQNQSLKTMINKHDQAEAKTPVLVLGCIPSTIDNLPEDQISSKGRGNPPTPVLEVHDGAFGALSEGGIFLAFTSSSGNHSTRLSTKVDVPFGLFMQKIGDSQ